MSTSQESKSSSDCSINELIQVESTNMGRGSSTNQGGVSSERNILHVNGLGGGSGVRIGTHRQTFSQRTKVSMAMYTETGRGG